MNLTRYRLNRKEGTIYQERDNQLVNIGESLLGAIVWHSEPFQAQLFGRPRIEGWVQLTILAETGELGYIMLNSGQTSALQPWLDYVQGLREQGFRVSQVATKIHFEYVESDDLFDYAFQAYQSPSLEERINSLLKNQKFSPVDKTLPVSVVRKLEDARLQSNSLSRESVQGVR